MSNANDFVIEDGVLTKYKGKSTEVIIPDGVVAIGDTAFKNKKNIVSVKIPEGVVKMGAKSFNGCCSMEILFIPSTLTEGLEWFYNLFGGCGALKEIVVAEGNPQYASEGGVLYLKFNGKITWLEFVPENIETVRISEEVKYIAGGAFANCRNLRSLDLPFGLESIGDECFKGCHFDVPLQIPENVGRDSPSCRDIGVPILANYSVVDPRGREQALIGFSVAYLQNTPMSENMKKDYITYARKQRKRLYQLAMQNEYVRHMMLAENIIPADDARILLDAATQQQNAEVAAELLAYLENK